MQISQKKLDRDKQARTQGALGTRLDWEFWCMPQWASRVTSTIDWSRRPSGTRRELIHKVINSHAPVERSKIAMYANNANHYLKVARNKSQAAQFDLMNQTVENVKYYPPNRRHAYLRYLRRWRKANGVTAS